MKELVVISGKGGTGKTSIVASFAALASNKVLADCDVDAADLHLVLKPSATERHPFRSGRLAEVITERCTGCGKCLEVCRFGAVRVDEPRGETGHMTYRIDPFGCEGCGVCHHFCPADAISFEEQLAGEWFISQTRFGTMVHARLGVAAENSGKLVTLVRNRARAIAERDGLDLVLVDGAPGIGCPVIASIAGASLVLVVTEPTLSGLHDLRRVCELARFFGIPSAVCVNKADINVDIAEQIEQETETIGSEFLGRVRYDITVTEAQVRGVSVIEHTDSGAARDVRELWFHTAAALARKGSEAAEVE